MAGIIGGIGGGTSPETEDSLGRSQMAMKESNQSKFEQQQAEIKRLQDLYAVAQKEIQRLRQLPDENEWRSNYYQILFWTSVILHIVGAIALLVA